MAVHDDAIFDLTPDDVTVDGTTSEMSTDGVYFPTSTIELFAILNTGHMYAHELGWTFLPGSDVDTVAVPVNISPPDFGYTYGNSFFTVHLGSDHPADNSDPPDVFLAGIELGTFDVIEGWTYYLELPITEDEGQTAPSTALKAFWLDADDASVGDEVIKYSSSSFPGSHVMYLYVLNPPAGATKVRLEIWAVPQNSVPLYAGAGFGISKAHFFKNTISNFYDDPQNVGYFGGSTPITYGRHKEVVQGREVILGQSERVTLDPPPTATEITLVAAWVVAPGSQMVRDAYWDFYPGLNGYNGIMNSAFGGPVGVTELGNVSALAMTFGEDLVSYFYDLSGEIILSENWGTNASPPYTYGEMSYSPGDGLLRMSVWNRILTEEEIAEALTDASGLVEHNITWGSSDHEGGTPITGYVVSVLSGGVVTEYPLPSDTMFEFVVPAGASAVQVAAVNAVGRSVPTELVF